VTSAFICSASLIGWAALLSALAARAERSLTGASSLCISFALAAPLGATACAVREPREALARGAVLVALTVGAIADARTGYVFDSVTLPAAVVAIVFAMGATGDGRPSIGALAIVAPLALLAASSWLGWGDVKAAFSLSLAFGPFESCLALFVACISGLAFAQTRRGRACLPRMPFVPHLAVGALTALIAARPLRALIGD